METVMNLKTAFIPSIGTGSSLNSVLLDLSGPQILENAVFQAVPESTDSGISRF